MITPNPQPSPKCSGRFQKPPFYTKARTFQKSHFYTRLASSGKNIFRTLQSGTDQNLIPPHPNTQGNNEWLSIFFLTFFDFFAPTSEGALLFLLLPAICSTIGLFRFCAFFLPRVLTSEGFWIWSGSEVFFLLFVLFILLMSSWFGCFSSSCFSSSIE